MPEKVFKVDIDSAVVDGFTLFADELGMKNKAVAERLLRYFLAQPDPIRRYMIGVVEGNEGAAISKFADALNKRSAATGREYRPAARSLEAKSKDDKKR